MDAHGRSLLAGGPDNQVHFEGYQVSNQCMALVRDECLLPCKDAPELGYVKESSSEQYVPDVFYKVRAQWWGTASGRRTCGHWLAWASTGPGAFWPDGPLVSCGGLVKRTRRVSASQSMELCGRCPGSPDGAEGPAHPEDRDLPIRSGCL